MTNFTCHTNDDQLTALQQNPTNGINPTTSPMTNGYHQSTNTTIQPPSDSKEGNPSSGKSLCNDSAASVQLPQTTTNNTQNYQTPYSHASRYIKFCKTHDTLEQYAGSIWHHRIRPYQTRNQHLQLNYTQRDTTTEPTMDIDDTTALLPAITSWHQPLSPIAYDGGRPGPPWPPPTKFLHVHTPTASTSTLTDLH